MSTQRYRSLATVAAPYAFPISLAFYVPICLFADAHVTLLAEQYGLGILTAFFLALAIRFSGGIERRQVLWMVAVASLVEVLSSLVWGVYHYRLHNVPLYVPPGHGLIYLFALRSARTPLIVRYERLVCRLALVAASAWSLYGVAVAPVIGQRIDVAGFLLLPIFISFLRRANAGVYAAAFLATSFLELVGTGFGNWTWQVSAPIIHIPVGNPPSVIAGMYCLMDFAATGLGKRTLQSNWEQLWSVTRRWSPKRAAAEG